MRILVALLFVALAIMLIINTLKNPQQNKGVHIQVLPTKAIPSTTNNDDIKNINSGYVPTIKTYTSTALGVRFKYREQYPWGEGGSKVGDYVTRITEKDSTIYIYDEFINTQHPEYTPAIKNPEDGQSVEVFSKDPDDSLAEAIRKRFLQGYNEKDCYVELNRGAVGNAEPTPAYREVASIVYPIDKESENIYKNVEKCPKGYTLSNGSSYFYMDTRHPDKMLFFDIGQYGIMADDRLWQDTVEIL